MGRHRSAGRASRHGERVTMLLENFSYPQDPRVRREAESLTAAGHAVEVVAPRWSGQPARETINGVVVRRYRAIEPKGSGIWSVLVEYASAAVALHLAAVRALLGGATVLHIHNPPDIFFPAGLLFRLAGRRVVFDHHDLAPELVDVKFGARRLARFARLCERLTFAVANHVLATNDSRASIASRRGGKAPSQVTVVRNGPPEAWTQLPLRIREGSLDPVKLAYVGAVAPQDGVDGMAEILACLRARNPPIRALLTVIGDGDGRPALEAALARHGVEDLVTISGWVAPERVPELLQDADVCVDPARPTELNVSSTMIKLSEYLALGKPTVAFDLAETRYTLDGAGVLIPPDDTAAFAGAIAELATDPARRRALASRARERARELTWERSEPALLAAYSSFNGAGG